MTTKHEKQQQLKITIKQMINEGTYNQTELFNRIYPSFRGHYSTLRDTIAEVKNGY